MRQCSPKIEHLAVDKSYTVFQDGGGTHFCSMHSCLTSVTQHLMQGCFTSKWCVSAHSRKRAQGGSHEENVALLESVNQTGRAFLSHTDLNGQYTLRLAVSGAQTQVSPSCSPVCPWYISSCLFAPRLTGTILSLPSLFLEQRCWCLDGLKTLQLQQNGDTRQRPCRRALRTWPGSNSVIGIDLQSKTMRDAALLVQACHVDAAYDR